MSITGESAPFELEFIELSCPYCSTGIDFVSDLAGTAQGCPNCGNSIVVPLTSGNTAQKLPLPMTAIQITLRRLVGEDWRSLMDYWPNVDDEQISQWLKEQQSESLTAEGQLVYLGIERKEDQAIIGDISFQFIDQSHRQVVFQVNANAEQMTDKLFNEACSTLFVFCFRMLNIHRIFTQFPAEDTVQEQRLISAGMRKEGNYKKDQYDGEKWRDTYQFALLQEEYLRMVNRNN